MLDVGCGDGLLAFLILEKRPDLDLRGIDVLVREQTHIPVDRFDGLAIPHADASFDVVMFVDVLHHTEDPMALLGEAVRVARKTIVVKDHTLNGFLAGPTLHFLDRVGNARHDVALPYNLLAPKEVVGGLRYPRVNDQRLEERFRTLPSTGELVFRPFSAFCCAT